MQSIINVTNLGTEKYHKVSEELKNVGQYPTWLVTRRCSYPDASAGDAAEIILSICTCVQSITKVPNIGTEKCHEVSESLTYVSNLHGWLHAEPLAKMQVLTKSDLGPITCQCN